MSFLKVGSSFVKVGGGGSFGRTGVVGGGGGSYVTGKTVLVPSDLTYLGRYRLPDDDTSDGAFGSTWHRYGFSKGAISGRYVGGQLRLFVSQASPNGAPIGEVIVDAEPTTAVAAPILTWRHNYGWPYDIVVGGGSEGIIRGYHWDEANQRLWFAWIPIYDGTSSINRTIGAATITGNAYSMVGGGPWRPTPMHSRKISGDLFAPPQTFVDTYAPGYTVWASAAQCSINASNAFGLGVFPVKPADVLGTAADSSTDQTDRGITPLTYQDYGVGTRMPRGGTFYKDDTNNESTYVDVTKFSDIDQFNGVVWVENATKRGLLCFGGIVDVVAGYDYTVGGLIPGETLPHLFYGNNQLNNCGHGQPTQPCGESQGWGTPTYVPELWIFNPDHFITPAQGGATNTMVATSKCQLNVQYGANLPATYPWGWDSCQGGCWYDVTTRRLYVSINQSDSTRFEPKPYIHVFEVAN